jgi:hypothetical protein
MPEKRKPSLLLTLGAAGLLIGGGATAYWVFLQSQGQLENLPVGSNIIPQDALVALSISTNTQQWQQLQQFGTPQIQAQLKTNLAQLGDRLLTANGYNYQRDIQPWVGKEVSIAFLPPSIPATSNSSLPLNSDRQQSLVMVLPIADQIAAKRILEQPKPSAQGKTRQRNYKGVEIRETQGAKAQYYSAAVLDGRYLIVTDRPQATDRAIDTYKGAAASLKQTAGYTTAFEQIATKQRFAQLYVNVPVAARIAAANPSRSFSPQGLAQLQNNQGVAATINLESEGIRLKSISWRKPDSQQVFAVENNAGKMQSRLPAETLMMLSSGNLQRLWQEYAREVQSNPQAPIRPPELRKGVTSVTGLDLDQDLLSWMDGEFAVSMVPAAPKAGAPDNFALSLVFLVQTKNRNKAEQALFQLERVMRSKYQFQVQETKIKDRTVTNWIAPYGTVATRGWLDGDVAFFALGAPVAERLIPQPQSSLASAAQFQQTVPSALNATNGQFFLDVEPTVKALPLPQLFSGQQIFFDATRSIGVTSAISSDHSIRYDVFVALKKIGNRESGKES